MRQGKVATLAWLCLAASCLYLLLAQEAVPKPEGVQSMFIEGMVRSPVGEALPNITVELRLKGASGTGYYKTASAKDGNYTFSNVGRAGVYELVFSGVGCNSVVREIPRPELLKTPIVVNVQMQCCGPSIPDTPHKHNAPRPYGHWLGKYRVRISCPGKPVHKCCLQLTNEAGNWRNYCHCTKENRFAVVTSETCPPAHACWRVTSDGDIVINFACEGVAFAGTSWTLWQEGRSLVGQTKGWTDCGCKPPRCDLRVKRARR